MQIMKKFLPFVLLSMLLVQVSAQTFTLQKTLNWDDTPIVHNPTGSFPLEIWNFSGAQFGSIAPSLPYHNERFQVPSMGTIDIEIINAQYEPFQKTASSDDDVLSTDIVFEASVRQNRNDYFANVKFIPIRKTGTNSFERLVSFELRARFSTQQGTSNTRGDNTYTSILSEGTNYKIAITETGIHKLSFDFLKNDLGIPIENVDPSKIKIYGNGGGPLPSPVITERYDDLQENSIYITGQGDGSFDNEDFILFYAEGPDNWSFDTENRRFHKNTNIYDTKNYYFIKVDGENGKRVGDADHVIPSISNTEYTSSSCQHDTRYEDDQRNLLADSPNSQGSGQAWYGDIFNPTRDKTYNFNIPNLKTDESIKMTVKFAGRSNNGSSSYSVTAGGQTSTSQNFPPVILTNPESQYANDKIQDVLFNTSSETFDIDISYPSVGDGTNKGWLDYIELNLRKNLVVETNPIAFYDANSLNFATSGFQLSGANASTLVWDITTSVETKLVSGTTQSGSNLSFGIQNDNKLHSFIAFDPNAAYSAPEAIGVVPNQNYHGIQNVDMVIVYHNDFLQAVQRFAEHRSSHSNLTIELVDINKLYNEFSSGRVDPTAIRDFAKMLFDRSGQFKYLLLMGDGSFDARNIGGDSKNFIPVYETEQSLHPVFAFPSDDYFALLTDDDGGSLAGDMEIAVGRIPVKTLEESNGVVDKIIRYDTQQSTLGDWKNRVTYVADDGDNNRHLKDADAIADDTRDEHLVLNFDKIYFDAYQQVSTSGDARFPEAQDALNRTIFRGVLALNYMGHGGGRGWAQERVLTNNDISNWTNADKLPLFVTATCSFAGYDDASFTSAGEQIMLKPDGGAIGLFTTTRAVFTSSNEKLTREVFDTLFQVTSGYLPPIGEILRIAKNNSAAGIENSRKFTLLGDPSLTLTIPSLDIVTTHVNGAPIGSQIDTIRALQEVTIGGTVLDENGNINTSFNGTVYPTIFDKKITINTLGQDDDSQVRPFELQKNILFKGRASVTNGVFSFTFVVPKDINYAYGYGKISYYAEDGSQVDARGYYDQIIIGGTDPNGIQDDEGPIVEVFMNDEDFVTGGLTDNNPTLLVKLSDDHGINVAGNSIGHDLTGVLDQNTSNTYILNDFYEAEVNNHRKGEVSFPLYNIEEGLHTIRVKAWDVANNSSEGFTEFLVAGGEDAALDHVLNYPNPFSTCTNFQFEHNLAGQLLDVQVQIFTVSGKLAKTVHTQVNAEGYRVTDIKWDGTDDYGDRLGRGVYVYKVKVRSLSDPSANIKGESDFEKLVILK